MQKHDAIGNGYFKAHMMYNVMKHIKTISTRVKASFTTMLPLTELNLKFIF